MNCITVFYSQDLIRTPAEKLGYFRCPGMYVSKPLTFQLHTSKTLFRQPLRLPVFSLQGRVQAFLTFMFHSTSAVSLWGIPYLLPSPRPSETGGK